ncbi:MAG: toxin [Chlamydiales bacterium]|nr:toxin [Chlamydiales bacterium]
MAKLGGSAAEEIMPATVSKLISSKSHLTKLGEAIQGAGLGEALLAEDFARRAEVPLEPITEANLTALNEQPLNTNRATLETPNAITPSSSNLSGSAAKNIQVDAAFKDFVYQEHKIIIDISSNASKVDKVITETLTGKKNLTSKYILTADEALELGQKWIGPNYSEIGKKHSGVFRSADGKRLFRMDTNSLLGNHPPDVPHIHLQEVMPNGLDFKTNIQCAARFTFFPPVEENGQIARAQYNHIPYQD